MKIFKELVNKLFGGHQRTALANKNVLYSFLFKGINIATQFALVPLMLHYLDASLYGIWLAISSILLWLSFFDLGVGNGLRVRLSKALAEDNLEMARTFISTAYATVTIVFILIMILFWIINPFINWSPENYLPQTLAALAKTRLQRAVQHIGANALVF